MYGLHYDGKILTWKGQGTYKATTGMTGYQKPVFQCVKERGPVPEGQYYVPLIAGEEAKDDGAGICQLSPSWQIQKIPRGTKAGACEPYWANWGYNRVRFEPADKLTKSKCDPKRSGFYLHDSTKGFSHGCIELEQSFFTDLRNFLKRTKLKRLQLTIKYTPGMDTNGGTKK